MSSTSGNGSSATPKPKLRAAPQPASSTTSRPNKEEIAYWDPKALCGLLLSQVSELTEQYMRSPPFLIWLRYSVQLENLCSRWIARVQSIQTSVPVVPNRTH